MRYRHRVGAVALAVFLGLACALIVRSAAGQTSAHPDSYALGPGDRIRVTVFGHADLSGEFTISETGTISLSLAGILTVGGATLAAAERTVVGALKPDYLLNPQVSIELLEYRPFYIIGEVNEPGSYPYVNGMSVTEAVALAGGYTHRAKENEAIVIRAADPDRTERSIPATDVVLPGDVVKIPERFF